MLVLPEATSYLGALQPPTHTGSLPAKCAQATSSGTLEGRAGPQCSVHQRCLALAHGDTALHGWDQDLSELTPQCSWTLMAQSLCGSPRGGGCLCPLPGVPPLLDTSARFVSGP